MEPPHRHGVRDPVACDACRQRRFCAQAVTLTDIEGVLVCTTPDGWTWSSADGGESWQLVRPTPPPPLSEWR